MSNICESRNSWNIFRKNQFKNFGRRKIAISELKLFFAEIAIYSALENFSELLFVLFAVEFSRKTNLLFWIVDVLEMRPFDAFSGFEIFWYETRKFRDFLVRKLKCLIFLVRNSKGSKFCGMKFERFENWKVRKFKGSKIFGTKFEGFKFLKYEKIFEIEKNGSKIEACSRNPIFL